MKGTRKAFLEEEQHVQNLCQEGARHARGPERRQCGWEVRSMFGMSQTLQKLVRGENLGLHAENVESLRRVFRKDSARSEKTSLTTIRKTQGMDRRDRWCPWAQHTGSLAGSVRVKRKQVVRLESYLGF